MLTAVCKLEDGFAGMVVRPDMDHFNWRLIVSDSFLEPVSTCRADG